MTGTCAWMREMHAQKKTFWCRCSQRKREAGNGTEPVWNRRGSVSSAVKWEGSGNVIALDVLRTLSREPPALDAYAAEVALAEGANRQLDYAPLELIARARKPVDDAQARSLCERMALVLQGSLLVRHAPRAVADAFCVRHFGEGAGLTYGTLPSSVDVAAIIRRQLSF